MPIRFVRERTETRLGDGSRIENDVRQRSATVTSGTPASARPIRSAIFPGEASAWTSCEIASHRLVVSSI